MGRVVSSSSTTSSFIPAVTIPVTYNLAGIPAKQQAALLGGKSYTPSDVRKATLTYEDPECVKRCLITSEAARNHR